MSDTIKDLRNRPILELKNSTICAIGRDDLSRDIGTFLFHGREISDTILSHLGTVLAPASVCCRDILFPLAAKLIPHGRSPFFTERTGTPQSGERDDEYEMIFKLLKMRTDGEPCCRPLFPRKTRKRHPARQRKSRRCHGCGRSRAGRERGKVKRR